MKKFKFNAYLLAALLCMITLVSCDDDDDDNEPSRRSLLTAVTWQGDEVFIDGDDWSDFVSPEDVTMVFNTNGTYLYTVDGDTDNGTWEFTDNEQKILFDKSTSFEYTADILELSASNLNVETTDQHPLTGADATYELRLIPKP